MVKRYMVKEVGGDDFSDTVWVCSLDYDKLEKENKELKSAMQEFVDRCDNGEIASTRTYNKFKELLNG